MKVFRSIRNAAIVLFAGLPLTGCQDPVEPKIAVDAPLSKKVHPIEVPTPIDPRLPPYHAADTPRLGRLRIVADASTIRLAGLWAATLDSEQPSLRVRATGAAQERPKWWHAGRAVHVALFREEMKPEERAAFEAEWGYPPQRLVVAMDPTVIVVGKDNPLVHRGVSLQELEAVFSDRPEGTAPIRLWDTLDSGEKWPKSEIVLYGQYSASPLARSFRARALRDGRYRADVVQLADSRSVIERVVEDPGGIGYASLSEARGPVAPVPIIESDTRELILPTADNLLSGRYPLSPGHLYLYINRRQGIALDALQRELVRFAYSQQGQKAAAEIGMVPVSAMQAVKELQRLDLRLSPENVTLASLPKGSR